MWHAHRILRCRCGLSQRLCPKGGAQQWQVAFALRGWHLNFCQSGAGRHRACPEAGRIRSTIQAWLSGNLLLSVCQPSESASSSYQRFDTASTLSLSSRVTSLVPVPHVQTCFENYDNFVSSTKASSTFRINPDLLQGAYGIIIEVESHPFELDTMLFMDWRDDHTSGAMGEANR